MPKAQITSLKAETAMIRFITKLAGLWITTIATTLRATVDGPNPSAPYSWTGQPELVPTQSSAMATPKDGFEGLC
jgi:hypothetical protein